MIASLQPIPPDAHEIEEAHRKIVSFTATYSIIAIIGLLVLVTAYLWLVRKMRAAKVGRPPRIHFFIIFATLAVLPIIGLISMIVRYEYPENLPLWVSPLVHSLIAIPVLIAPICFLVSALVLFPRRKASIYHKAALCFAAGYLLVAVLLILLAY